ncbi:MAG: gliding motility-associated C-terminal domain-containing protein [Bacteroidetes bacterium]|nr:gliding motility-associated C-terminal domain-containing protein [Bacteroidota bacterium]
MKAVCNTSKWRRRVNTRIIIFLFFFFIHHISFSQCPANIDFESGTFDGWNCWVGSVSDFNGVNNISLHLTQGPVAGQHTMLSSVPGDGLDEYGGFPKNCPNGSGHSVKLGNDQAGGFAEGLSYQFTVPLTSNKFTLTYSYAVVFEDPGHNPEKQPRLEVEVWDVTAEEMIDCFSFEYIAVGGLPGFQVSPVQPHTSPVLYKDWTTNTIYLNGYEGKTIMLFFKTADCTYAIHFGYAYLDVSSRCDNSIAGETFCAQDTAINVNGPSGYQQYNWFNNNFTQLLGTQQILHLEPPPAAGTHLQLEMIPFPGYGCRDTLDVELQDTLTAVANAGPDLVSCNLAPVQLGVPAVGGMQYSWNTNYGFYSSNTVSNPVVLPSTDTSYILTMQSEGGGCFSRDTVHVLVRNINNTLQLSGDQKHCMGNGPDPVLSVSPVNQVQWYKDDLPIPGANQLTYTVRSSGVYSAALTSNVCSNALRTPGIVMTIDTALQGITYPPLDIAYNFSYRLQARGNNFANSVTWTPATNLDDSHRFAPYFRGITPQLYTIELKTGAGCTTVDTQYVKTHKEIALYVPSVFTPDGDGINDYLRPLLLGFDKLKYFRIYNRWGKLIFESNNELPGWNGRIGNVVQETQSVVWILEATDMDGHVHFKKGTTLLLR